jgi:hypothetical protein
VGANLKITCLNTGAIVLLKARVLIDDNAMVEVVTAQDGTPVDTITFTRSARNNSAG